MSKQGKPNEPNQPQIPAGGWGLTVVACSPDPQAASWNAAISAAVRSAGRIMPALR